eukprot:885073_1
MSSNVEYDFRGEGGFISIVHDGQAVSPPVSSGDMNDSKEASALSTRSGAPMDSLDLSVAPSARRPVDDFEEPVDWNGLGMSRSSEEKIDRAGSTTVRVCNPARRGEGMQAYITYRIETTVHGPSGSSPKSSIVDRRFSDFVWLRSKLHESVKGVIIPPMPNKVLIGRFSMDFIEHRRRKLEIFLKRCLLHELLRESGYLRTFLHGDSQALDDVKQESPDPNEPRGIGGYISSYFGWGGLSATITQGLEHLGVVSEPSKTAEDVKCDTISDFVNGFKDSLDGVQKQSVSLNTKIKDLASAWDDFSNALSNLKEHQKQNSELGLDLVIDKLSSCSVRLAVAYNQQMDRDQLLLVEPLQDAVKVVEAVQEMLQTREAALAFHQADTAALENMQGRLEAYRSQRGKEHKAAALQEEFTMLQRKVQSSKEDLDLVTQRVFKEIDRFKREKNDDLRLIITAFIKSQIRLAKNVQSFWEQALAEIPTEPAPKSRPPPQSEKP